MEYIKIFAPATVANVSCGFDSLGFAVDAVGDEMTFTKTVKKGVKITNITKYNHHLTIKRDTIKFTTS